MMRGKFVSNTTVRSGSSLALHGMSVKNVIVEVDAIAVVMDAVITGNKSNRGSKLTSTNSVSG